MPGTYYYTAVVIGKTLLNGHRHAHTASKNKNKTNKLVSQFMPHAYIYVYIYTVVAATYVVTRRKRMNYRIIDTTVLL